VDVGRTKRLVLRTLNTIGSLDCQPVTADELTGIDGRVEVADMDGRTTSGRRCRRYRIAGQD